jgi:nitrite reductase/ring-hydroxylating ferredoxin subunit
VRARIREQLGLFTWLDRPSQGSETPRAPAPPPSSGRPELVRLLPLDELPDGQVVEVVAGDRTLALANAGGKVYAIDGTCAHAGGPLGDGTLEGCTLTCPWHGWSYDLQTGQSSVDPSVRLKTYPVKVVDGAVWLDPTVT